MGDGGSNGAISGWIKFKMAAGGHFEKNQTATSLQINALSDSLYIMTVDAYRRRLDAYFTREDN